MGREAAAGTGFLFHPGCCFPPLLRAAAARARSRPPVPAGARSCARPPAGLALPGRLAAWLRSSAEDPRPGRTSPRAAPRTRGPPRHFLSGPRGRTEETRGCGGTVLAESARARRGSRPPSRPECGILGGGGLRLEGAKMALGLARRQGWWRSCSAGAIFPGGAGGALRGRFSGPGAGRARATGSHAWGAEFCKWGRSRGRGRLALAFPVPPDPKDEEAGPEREGTGAGGVLLLSTCVGGKKWGLGSDLAAGGFPL